jgi:hypothetical protein
MPALSTSWKAMRRRMRHSEMGMGRHYPNLIGDGDS